MYIYIHIYIHTYIHIYVYMYIYIARIETLVILLFHTYIMYIYIEYM